MMIYLPVLLWLLLAAQDPIEAKDLKRQERAPATNVLVLLQEVTGRPGSPEEVVELQQVYIGSDRILLEDRSRGLYRILRLDKPQPLVWEISGDGSMYREITDLSRIQKDRRLQEQQLVERTRDLPQSERAALLEASHIRLSSEGKIVREIRVEEKSFDGERLGMPVRQVLLHENDRLIADLLVADISTPFSLARFHRASGAFSEEVLAALEKIHGLPLEGTIQVVTATLTHPLVFKVRQWGRKDVDPAIFDLPANCTLIEDKAFVHCPVCGQEVEREASAARARKRDGTWYYFDRRSCFRSWRLHRLEEN
jgi:YHS domain-containing protein